MNKNKEGKELKPFWGFTCPLTPQIFFIFLSCETYA